MIRSVKMSIGGATQRKTASIAALLREYRAATNFYIDSLWETRGALDAATLNRYTGGSLGYRQKSDSLAMALETVIATRKAAKAKGRPCSKPHLTGAFRVSSLCAKIEPFRGEGFDYAIKLSGLVPGTPIVVPVKSHAKLDYWPARDCSHLQSALVLPSFKVSAIACAANSVSLIPQQRPA